MRDKVNDLEPKGDTRLRWGSSTVWHTTTVRSYNGGAEIFYGKWAFMELFVDRSGRCQKEKPQDGILYGKFVPSDTT